jgi:prolyl 4-hydroxylase
LQHFDAFDLSDANGRRFASNGGQRVVTVLVYLNTLTEEQGGATHFPNLNLKVQPKQGMALVFFPSTVDGLLDRQALHAALPPRNNATKYVSQVWVRQAEYKGDPSKRLNPIMGIQNYQPPSVMDVLQLKAAAGASLT